MSTEVVLVGQLICRTEEELDSVRLHLPGHVDLTRAESGCLSFDVEPSDDPLVWMVHERFADVGAFRAHQDRVAASHWARATAGIERRYRVDGRQV